MVRIDVARMLKALTKTLWKQGMVRPELLRHIVNKDGSHTVTLTLAKEHVVGAPPKRIDAGLRPEGVGTPERGGAPK
jgi:hypothetical protein